VASLILLAAAGASPAEEILLGRVDREAILSISAEWRANHDNY